MGGRMMEKTNAIFVPAAVVYEGPHLRVVRRRYCVAHPQEAIYYDVEQAWTDCLGTSCPQCFP